MEAPPPEASRIAQSSDIVIHLPLHYYVWHQNVHALVAVIEAHPTRIESRDAHGRTPLMLATVLGHREVALELLKYGASVLTQDKDGFTALHSALTNPGDVSSSATEDFKYMHQLLECEAYQRAVKLSKLLTTNIAHKMANISDYYFEMKCQLYPGLLPFFKLKYYSDTLKVYISSNRIRVDTTVAQIDGLTVVRGNLSYVINFNTSQDGTSTVNWLEIDHESKRYIRNYVQLTGRRNNPFFSESAVMERMKEPIQITTTSPVTIEPVMKGWLYKTHKTETVDGLHCNLYDMVEATVKSQLRRVTPTAPYLLPTELEYFTGNKDVTPPGKVTHSIEQVTSNRYSVTSDPVIPLSLEQNVLPFLELLSECMIECDARTPRQSWQSKLSQMVDYPQGFPVQLKLEMTTGVLGLKVKITLGNVQAQVTAVEGVRVLEDGQCEIQGHMFQVPQEYTNAGL